MEYVVSGSCCENGLVVPRRLRADSCRHCRCYTDSAGTERGECISRL